MAKYRVTGRVRLRVADHETVRIDDIYEADDEDDAQDKAEEYAENSQFADDVEIDYSDLTITRIVQTAEEIAAEESLATYRAMRRMKAPQLPGMEAY